MEKKEKSYIDIDILDYKKTLECEGYKLNTIRLHLLVIRTFYEYLNFKGEKIINPCSKFVIPAEKIGTVKALGEDSIKKILNYLESKEDYIKVLFYLMLYGGLRIGEVAKLKTKDIQFVNDRIIISIPGEIAKGKKSRISPYIDGYTGKFLLDYIENNNHKYLSRISKRTIQYHAKQISKAIEVKFNCHMLRHNYATELLNRGISLDIIQTALGHKNIETTRRYAETLLQNVVDVAAKI